MQFINIVVHSVEDMNFRVHLQYEFTKLGLEEFLQVSWPGPTGVLGGPWSVPVTAAWAVGPPAGLPSPAPPWGARIWQDQRQERPQEGDED